MRNNRSRGILATLLSAAEKGILTGLPTFTAEGIAPKITPLLSPAPSHRQLSQSLWYAKRRGFLSSGQEPAGLTVSLTYKGREQLFKLKRLALKITTPASWDGKWRMVTFDIPETRRYARDNLRLTLKKLGFRKLEGSLWVYPYECREELKVVTDALMLTPHVRYFLVESFDGEREMAEGFGIQRSMNSEQRTGRS